MKTLTQFCSVMLAGGVLLAQGPPPGPRGHGFGPGGPEFGIRSEGPWSKTPVTGAPYSATQITQFQQNLSGGNQISRQEQSKVYRDLQGRVRIEHTRTPPGATAPETQVTIFDPVASATYLLDPATKTVVKLQLPPAHSATSQRQGRPAPPAGAPQLSTEDLGKQAINGVPATGSRVTETIPAGAIGNAQPILVVRETWISTELKIPVQIKTTDPRFGNTSMQLSNIAQSEPDASLFQVPSDYTVSAKTTHGGFPPAGGMRQHRPQQ